MMLAGLVVLASTGMLGAAKQAVTAGMGHAAPTATTRWVTYWVRSGLGSAYVGPLALQAAWRLEWSCNPASLQGKPYDLLVELDPTSPTPHTAPFHPPVTLHCEPGTTSGNYATYTDTADVRSGLQTLWINIDAQGESRASWAFSAETLVGGP
jgi:hypothetical protein